MSSPKKVSSKIAQLIGQYEQLEAKKQEELEREQKVKSQTRNHPNRVVVKQSTLKIQRKKSSKSSSSSEEITASKTPQKTFKPAKQQGKIAILTKQLAGGFDTKQSSFEIEQKEIEKNTTSIEDESVKSLDDSKQSLPEVSKDNVNESSSTLTNGEKKLSTSLCNEQDELQKSKSSSSTDNKNDKRDEIHFVDVLPKNEEKEISMEIESSKTEEEKSNLQIPSLNLSEGKDKNESVEIAKVLKKSNSSNNSGEEDKQDEEVSCEKFDSQEEKKEEMIKAEVSQNKEVKDKSTTTPSLEVSEQIEQKLKESISQEVVTQSEEVKETSPTIKEDDSLSDEEKEDDSLSDEEKEVHDKETVLPNNGEEPKEASIHSQSPIDYSNNEIDTNNSVEKDLQEKTSKPHSEEGHIIKGNVLIISDDVKHTNSSEFSESSHGGDYKDVMVCVGENKKTPSGSSLSNDQKEEPITNINESNQENIVVNGMEFSIKNENKISSSSAKSSLCSVEERDKEVYVNIDDQKGASPTIKEYSSSDSMDEEMIGTVVVGVVNELVEQIQNEPKEEVNQPVLESSPSLSEGKKDEKSIISSNGDEKEIQPPNLDEQTIASIQDLVTSKIEACQKKNETENAAELDLSNSSIPEKVTTQSNSSSDEGMEVQHEYANVIENEVIETIKSKIKEENDNELTNEEQQKQEETKIKFIIKEVTSETPSSSEEESTEVTDKEVISASEENKEENATNQVILEEPKQQVDEEPKQQVDEEPKQQVDEEPKQQVDEEPNVRDIQNNELITKEKEIQPTDSLTLSSEDKKESKVNNLSERPSEKGRLTYEQKEINEFFNKIDGEVQLIPVQKIKSKPGKRKQITKEGFAYRKTLSCETDQSLNKVRSQDSPSGEMVPPKKVPVGGVSLFGGFNPAKVSLRKTNYPKEEKESSIQNSESNPPPRSISENTSRPGVPGGQPLFGGFNPATFKLKKTTVKKENIPEKKSQEEIPEFMKLKLKKTEK
ncbi:Uroadherence factor A precursor, putative [Entamoeba histolytica KU27]|uniref:Uroadherence factor A, putative n=1 Tax=Entamoeba histolytica KU27 TaxID=885311 RepID=M2S9E7_ENTHI|nr:Uroadherence factor A precursor, putative [Entamoeba histolytica KU27]